MKKIATALASVTLVATLAAPAGAAVVSQPGPTFRHQRSQPAECYGHRRWSRGRDCTDEHHPQHDGNGSILF